MLSYAFSRPSIPAAARHPKIFTRDAKLSPDLLCCNCGCSTLKNAAVVRDILESSGVVLATFSGHDHVHNPYNLYMAEMDFKIGA